MDSTLAHIPARKRLAWVVLFGSFFICLIISIATPFLINAGIKNATQPLNTIIEANQGSVRIDDETGATQAVLIRDEPGAPVESPARILTDANASALILFHPPESEQLFARLKVNNNSILNISQATAPRFSLSRAGYVVELALDNGRLGLTVLEAGERPLTLHIKTPQGQITLNQPGEYSLDVNNDETQVSIRAGEATIEAIGEQLLLQANQRAIISTDSAPAGPFDPARNLIKNGGFNVRFANWADFVWNVELGDQPKGKTDIIDQDGESTLRFARGGAGHADTKIHQTINQNVVDYTSLQLLTTLRINDQSLGVCGNRGSECPLFIVINYLDQQGTSQVWQHGFYGQGEIDDNDTPDACISCAVIQSTHERVPLGQDYFYEVDLLDALARQGALPPRKIESISLIASGHSFMTEVVDIALIAEE